MTNFITIEGTPSVKTGSGVLRAYWGGKTWYAWPTERIYPFRRDERFGERKTRWAYFRLGCSPHRDASAKSHERDLAVLPQSFFVYHSSGTNFSPRRHSSTL